MPLDTPTWIDQTIKKELLNDETSLVKLGESDDIYFTNNREGVSNFSAWNKFPTEKNPENLYQYSRIIVTVGTDLKLYNRVTYGLLDWLGDVGGLLDGLSMVGEFFCAPFATIALQ